MDIWNKKQILTVVIEFVIMKLDFVYNQKLNLKLCYGCSCESKNLLGVQLYLFT